MQQRVFETLETDRTGRAHALRALYAQPVRGKELSGIGTTAARVKHPCVFVGRLRYIHISSNGRYERGVPRVHHAPRPRLYMQTNPWVVDANAEGATSANSQLPAERFDPS